jgi:long-chain acyl-CoA synthetase
VLTNGAQRDDITKETIDEDKWLHTGDIGQWNSDGTLSLIDRKKVCYHNCVRIAHG